MSSHQGSNRIYSSVSCQQSGIHPSKEVAKWPAVPARNSFLSLSVCCAGVANFFSWTFRTGSAILRTDRQKPGRKMSRDSLRKHLSMPGMLRAVRACLHRIADPIDTRGISLSDCLMSGPAVFSLRMPSLLQFDRQVRGGGEPPPAVRRGAGAVGHLDAPAAGRSRPAGPPPPLHGHPRGAAARKGAGRLDGVRRPSAGLRRRHRIPFLPQGQLPQPLRQGAPRRHGDIPSSGTRGGGRAP